MQAIIEACQNNTLNAMPSVVISSQENAKGIDKAKHHGIETKVCKHDEDILKELIKYQVDLVILAGYMKLIGKTILKAYPNRVLNIHPSLLPSFKGLNAQKQALDYGVKITGCTVHIVDEKIDNGPILGQSAVAIKKKDTPTRLSERILKAEHKLYPKTIQDYLSQLKLI